MNSCELSPKRRRLVDTSSMTAKDRIERFRKLYGEHTSLPFAADISIHGQSIIHPPMKPMLMHSDESCCCPVVPKRMMNIVHPYDSRGPTSQMCVMQEACYFRQLMASAIDGQVFFGEVFDPPVSPKVVTDKCLLCIIFYTLHAIGNPTQDLGTVINPFRVLMGSIGEFDVRDIIQNQPGIFGCFPLIDTYMWVVTTTDQHQPCIRLACEDFQVGAGLDHHRAQIRSIDMSNNTTQNSYSPQACSDYVSKGCQ